MFLTATENQRPSDAGKVAARAIGRIEALRQILLAITCAGKLIAAARQASDAADEISSNELNALFDVLDTEFKRRRRIAKAAVAAMPKPP